MKGTVHLIPQGRLRIPEGEEEGFGGGGGWGTEANYRILQPAWEGAWV